MIHDLLVGKSAITPSLNLVWHDDLFLPGLSFWLYPKVGQTNLDTAVSQYSTAEKADLQELRGMLCFFR